MVIYIQNSNSILSLKKKKTSNTVCEKFLFVFTECYVYLVNLKKEISDLIKNPN